MKWTKLFALCVVFVAGCGAFDHRKQTWDVEVKASIPFQEGKEVFLHPLQGAPAGPLELLWSAHDQQYQNPKLTVYTNEQVTIALQVFVADSSDFEFVSPVEVGTTIDDETLCQVDLFPIPAGPGGSLVQAEVAMFSYSFKPGDQYGGSDIGVHTGCS